MYTEEKYQAQMNHSKEEMIRWLSHKNELGKKPAKIECTQRFIYNDMAYYIYRFKKGFLSNWMIGICGGYETEECSHCGHLFSQYQPYNETTEKEDSIKIIEMIMDYWRKRAEEYSNKTQ
jgi:hypothetical protein